MFCETGFPDETSSCSTSGKRLIGHYDSEFPLHFGSIYLQAKSSISLLFEIYLKS